MGLELLSHCRRRAEECMDGVAGLEGRLGNLSHARKFVWRRVVVLIADGGVWRGKAIGVLGLEM
jgi:hypothetical protein